MSVYNNLQAELKTANIYNIDRSDPKEVEKLLKRHNEFIYSMKAILTKVQKGQTPQEQMGILFGKTYADSVGEAERQLAEIETQEKAISARFEEIYEMAKTGKISTRHFNSLYNTAKEKRDQLSRQKRDAIKYLDKSKKEYSHRFDSTVSGLKNLAFLRNLDDWRQTLEYGERAVASRLVPFTTANGSVIYRKPNVVTTTQAEPKKTIHQPANLVAANAKYFDILLNAAKAKTVKAQPKIAENIAIGSGKWALGLVEMLTNPQTLVSLSTLGENGIKLLGRILTPKSLEEVFGFNKTELSSAEKLIPSHWRGPINPKWVEASNETQLATMLGLDVATLLIGIGEISMALKGTKVVTTGAKTAKNSEGILNLMERVFSKSKTAAPITDISTLKVPQGISEAKFTEISNVLRNKVGHIGDDIRIHGSRANGTAGATNDLDIAIRVDQQTFDKLIRKTYGDTNPGSNKYYEMLHAIKTGKINDTHIQLPEQKLKRVKEEVFQLLSKDLPLKKVDLSIIKVGGQFDQGPWILIK